MLTDPHIPIRPVSGRAAKGLTFAELLIAISITAVVGVAVAGVTIAVSNAGVSADDQFECEQGVRVARARSARYVQQAALVTAVEDERLLLWMGDADGSRSINLDELVLLKFEPNSRDPDQSRLVRYWVEFPDDMHWLFRRLLNREYSLHRAGNARSMEFWMRLTSYGRESTIATHVSSARFSAEPEPPLSRIAQVKLTVSVGEHSATRSGTATLRADRTGDVEYRFGRYWLAME